MFTLSYATVNNNLSELESKYLRRSAEKACEDLCKKTSSTRETLTMHELIRISSDAWRNLSEYECMY